VPRERPAREEVNMFGDSFNAARQQTAGARRWLTVPLSLLLHVAVVFLFVVIPLLQAERFPTLKECAQLVALVPPPAPAPHGKKADPTPAREPARTEPVRQPLPGHLVAPKEPPTTIDPDPLPPDLGDGDKDGIEGGPIIDNGPAVPIIDVISKDKPTTPLRLASVQRPVLVKRVSPVYPVAAQSAHLTGHVVIEAATDVYGRVKEVRVVSGHPLFNEAAVTAVRQWIYEPYIVYGVPKPVLFTVVVEFVLN
jgi:periplasmic protein TonB